jgi:formylglycine-generating enzyme required for sulfatase activity
MIPLAPALRQALIASAATLREGVQSIDPDAAAALGGLAALAEPGEPAAAFDNVVQRAANRLRRAYPDPGIVDAALAVLAAPGLACDRFRRIALEEFVLSAQTDLGRIADWYRRDLRRMFVSNRQTMPAWNDMAPVLALFLGTLLPQAAARQHALRGHWPGDSVRSRLNAYKEQIGTPNRSIGDEPDASLLTALLAPERSGTPVLLALDDPAAALALGAEIPAQQIIASNGATIAQVQQTVIYADRYSPGLHPPDLETLERRYRTFLVETFGMLDFRGILQVQHVARLPLDELYVAPVAAIESGITCLHAIVRDLPLLVVLGRPGAGKSTLVRYILLSLAEGRARQRVGLSDDWLPIFFPVAAFAEARRQPGHRDLSPLDYLSTYYNGLSQPDYTPLFAQSLEQGHALVLLDGLDEVPDDRLRLTHCLEAFVRQWDATGNRFLATSRIVGYDDAPFDDRLFVRATIQPFDDAAIRTFVERWSAVYERSGPPSELDLADQAELERRIIAHAASLRTAVFANPGVTDLARNPLLLTILALIHNQGAQMPDRRVDLYRLCVEALAETWNRARSLSGREVDVYLSGEKLSERFVVNVLGPFALWLHTEQPGGMVEQRDLEHHLATTLAQIDGLPRGQAQRLARSFIDLMRRDVGLLQEHGYRRFGFLHRTFEEYLAARALIESVAVENPDARFRSYSRDPHWHEVLRLAVAAAPQRESQRLLFLLIGEDLESADATGAPPALPTHETQDRARAVVLAGECLLDIGRSGATQRASAAVTAALLEVLATPEAPLAARVSGGRILGQLGDPRLLDPSYWGLVEAGPFWYGDDREGGRRGPVLKQVHLPASYRIARFPVTNAEYRRFVEAGGYDERRWWTPAGWAFLRATGRRSHSAADGLVRAPRLWEHNQFNHPAQPVVGVSWYEAAAYAAWLTEQALRTGHLAPGDRLRLPTGLEWERAARHIDRRRYPWGNQAPDDTHANFDTIGLRAPAPVGCFPSGVAECGAADLAGNVWEWTATLWDCPEEVAPCADLTRAQMPMIRGGAFNWDAGYLACGARYWFNPSRRFNLLGFRLVWAMGDG